MGHFEGLLQRGDFGLPFALDALLYPFYKDIQHLLIIMESHCEILEQFVPLPLQNQLKFPKRSLKPL